MPVFLKDGRAVLFVHVPKTGGSSIEQLFRESGWDQRLHETPRTEPLLVPLRRCPPQHLHAELLQAMLRVAAFDLVFMVTREPVSRFRSEYLMRHRQERNVEASAVEAWGRKIFDRHDKNPYALDNHLRPQHEFELPASEVFRLEDGLGSVTTDLNERFGLGLGGEIPRSMDLSRSGKASSGEVQVSPSLERLIRERYAEDFRRYGY